jgi:hypothetical protein
MDSPITVADSGIPTDLKGASKQVSKSAKALIAPFDFIVVSHDKSFSPNGPLLQFRDANFRAYCLEGAAPTKIKLSNLKSWSAKLSLVSGGYVELRSAPMPNNYHVDFDPQGKMFTSPIPASLNGMWVSFLPGLNFNSVTVTTDPPPGTPYSSYPSAAVIVHYCSNKVPCNPDPCP